MLPFPMPNDMIRGHRVVASVEYRDDPTMIATVLLLEPQEPYLTVALYYMEDCPPEDGEPAVAAGTLRILMTARNIVTAVRTLGILMTARNIVTAVHEYEQAGVDI